MIKNPIILYIRTRHQNTNVVAGTRTATKGGFLVLQHRQRIFDFQVT